MFRYKAWTKKVEKQPLSKGKKAYSSRPKIRKSDSLGDKNLKKWGMFPVLLIAKYCQVSMYVPKWPTHSLSILSGLTCLQEFFQHSSHAHGKILYHIIKRVNTQLNNEEGPLHVTPASASQVGGQERENWDKMKSVSYYLTIDCEGHPTSCPAGVIIV